MSQFLGREKKNTKRFDLIIKCYFNFTLATVSIPEVPLLPLISSNWLFLSTGNAPGYHEK